MQSQNMHQFKTEQFLPVDLETAWNFFSSPKNLSVITPPEMDFKILTHLGDDGIYEGMKIDYTVRPLFGIKVHWQTEISKVMNQSYFTDKQNIGPYKIWEHTHSFLKVSNGVQMTDVIDYKLPFGFLGLVAHKLVIRNKIESIFMYRKNILEKLFA